MIDAMMASLTQPISPEENKPRAKKSGDEKIKFTADTIDSAIEDINQTFLDNQWSDGLPIIPPTPARVRWMLSGTNRSPDEVLGRIAPRNGEVTIKKLAINAVMAGAKPEYMPVIIAAIEGLADPEFDDLHFATSTGSFNLVIGVSGPIADEIGMNSGLGLFSYGNRANSSIGRAVRLAIINFGHTWPGQNDMALIGRPGAHAFLTFAENQAQSPWPSYHEALGFKPEDSTVTLTVTGGYGKRSGTNVYGGGAVRLVSPETILKGIASDISRVRGGVIANDSVEGLLAGNENAVRSSYRKYFIIFNPEVAQELHDRLGYTRKKIQEYLFETSSVPYEDLSERNIEMVKRAIDTGYIPVELVGRFRQGLRPGGMVPMMSKPGDAQIIVAGGIPGYTMMMSYFLDGVYKPTGHITKLVRNVSLAKADRRGNKSLTAR